MGSTWVDSHCHLTMVDEPAGSVLDRAAAAGVAWVVAPGVDLESTLAARRVAGAHPSRVRWTAGLHPHEASRWSAEGGRIAALAADAAAVGECGLDFYRDLSPRDEQRTAFREQVAIASDLGKALIVHCRDAFAEVFDVLEEAHLGERAVLHCWTGGPRWTKRFDGLGVTFSFAGPITVSPGDTVRRGAAEAPPQRTIVETDSPYLSPEPHRGTPNFPERVPLTGAVLARIWGIDIAEASRITSENAARVFGRPDG